MRATRDLLRRRHRLVRLRAEAYTHIQLVFHQYGILDIESGIVQNKTKRRQLIERFSEDDIRKNIATDLDVIDALDPVIAQLESQITRQAKYHRSRDYSILLTVPGVGPMIALNILYEMSCLDRFKSVQSSRPTAVSSNAKGRPTTKPKRVVIKKSATPISNGL